jgi:hypothetical protein
MLDLSRAPHHQTVNARRPGSIGEGARFLNRQLSNRLFGKTAGLSQLFDFLSLLQYKVCALCLGGIHQPVQPGQSSGPYSPEAVSNHHGFMTAAHLNPFCWTAVQN